MLFELFVVTFCEKATKTWGFAITPTPPTRRRSTLRLSFCRKRQKLTASGRLLFQTKLRFVWLSASHAIA
jgi:hypothetical protein